MCCGQMSIHVILTDYQWSIIGTTWQICYIGTDTHQSRCFMAIDTPLVEVKHAIYAWSFRQFLGTHHPINKLNTIHVLLTDVNGESCYIGTDTNQDVRWPLVEVTIIAWSFKQFLDTYHPINKLNTLHVLWIDQSIIGTTWQRCYMTIETHLFYRSETC